MSSSKKQLSESARRARNLRRRSVRVENLEGRLLMTGPGTVQGPWPLGGANFGPVSAVVQPPPVAQPYLPTLSNVKDLQGYLTGPSQANPLDIVLGYMRSKSDAFGLTADDLTQVAVTNLYSDSPSGTTHIYLRQVLNGVEVNNAVASANVDVQGRIINVASRFVHNVGAGIGQVVPQAALSATDALLAAAPVLGLTSTGSSTIVANANGVNQASTINVPGISLDDIPTKLQYVATGSGTVLTWSYMVRTPDGDHWYDLNVDASQGKPVSAVDWIEHAVYNVVPLPGESPLDVPRKLVTDPANTTASPYGWHDTNGIAGAEFTDTRGNNVSAQADTAGDDQGTARPDGGTSLTFNYPYNKNQSPSTYLNAAITNLFYMNNMLHDIHYHYGFNEAAGNFQTNNYGNGGVGGDAVQADGQDGGGLDNANFGTPPDGFAPRMQMYLWDTANPMLDGDFDNQVITHEFGHGVSNRLTGGAANASALFAIQSGGMGEGWSDWWSLMLTQKSTDVFGAAYPVGNYVLNTPNSGPGIRRYPYSFDMGINPQTIADFNGGFPNWESHNAGELWCDALWDMSELLVQKYGFNGNLQDGYTGKGSAGNILAMQIVMDALKLQPANPSFSDARDAIVQADFVLTGGENRKEIWTAFARRGMGLSFTAPDSNSTKVTATFDTPNFVTGVPNLQGQVGSTTDFANIVVANYTEGIVDPPGVYTASINWGDGTATAPATVQLVGKTLNVLSSHVYSNYGNYKMTVVVNNSGLWSETVVNQVTVLDAPITPSSTTVSGEEGFLVSGNFATFTSGNLSATPAQFRASIRWGDTYATPGLIQVNPDGGFSVYGSHSYRQGGKYDVTVQITSLGGAKATAKSTANISDSIIETSSLNVNAQEAIIFSGALATYVDKSPDPVVSDWTAVINWGDNTPTSKAVIASGVVFSVNGQHAYAQYGNYDVTVTLTNSTKTATYTVISKMNVTEAPVDGKGIRVDATVGSPYTGALVTYTDANPLKPISDFSAKVNWGDGTITDGILTNLGNGKFSVSGGHTYLSTGATNVVVQLISKGGTPIEPITLPASVTDAPLIPSFSDVAVGPANNPSASSPGLTVSLGDAFNKPLLTFISTDPNALANDFGIVINWGDGTQTGGTLSKVGSSTATTSTFTLSQPHTYASAGAFPLSVKITSKGGKVTQATGVGRVLLPLSGTLDGSSDTGASSSDQITSKDALLFKGTAEFNSTVKLYARPADGSGGKTLIGTATANGLGAWSTTTNTTLNDGRYIISASTVNSNGTEIQSRDLGSNPVVTIDKSGPGVVSVNLDPKRGQATIFFADNGSGVIPSGLLNPASYSLTLPGKRGTSSFPTLSVVPLATFAANGQQGVLVTFKTKGKMVNGGYVIKIDSNVVSDLAGNALFDRTFVAFPQLTNTPINTFIAQIDVRNGIASAPRQYVPLPEIIAAQNYSNSVKNGNVRLSARRRR